MKRTVSVVLVTCLAASLPSLVLAATRPAAKSASGGKGAPAVVDSLGLLEHEVAQDSSNFENLFRLGGMYMDRDKSEDALKVWSKANQIKPKDVPTLVNLGAVLDALGRPSDAQTYYRKALKLRPGDEIATCRLASSLYSRSEYQESMSLLRGLVAKNSKAYCAYFTMGVAFADAGIYSEAINMWKKVVALAPDSPEAVSARESITVLEKYLKGQP